MSENRTLPNTPLNLPIPYDNESIGSVLLRVSELNGWKIPNSFLKRHGVNNSISNLMSNTHRWLKACSKIGIKISKKYQESYENNKMYSHASWVYGLEITKICPLCIESLNYAPKIWNYRILSYCTDHHVQLINRCESCMEYITWNRLGLNKCRCGFNYIDTKLKPFPNKPLSVIDNAFNNNDEKVISVIFRLFLDIGYIFEKIKIKITDYQQAKLSVLIFQEDEMAENIIHYEVARAADFNELPPQFTLSSLIKSKDLVANNLGLKILNSINLIVEPSYHDWMETYI